MKKGTVLITGGARRIGQAIALSLAEEGHSIALHYNSSKNQAEALQKKIEASGAACALFSMDLSDQTDVADLISQVLKVFPDLNVLINNASVFKKTSLMDNSREEFARDFRVHLQSPFILIQAFAKSVKEGKIINIVDAAISKNKTDFFSYLLAKKSLANLTQMAARELAPSIRVNAVAPGFILAQEGNEASTSRIKEIPLKVQGKTENITETVKFLLNNNYITGQTIFVDGGEHLI